MTLALIIDEDARRESASDWLVRLSAPVDGDGGLDEAALGEFDAWLADPANAAAYDAVLATTLELQAAAPAILQGLGSSPARKRPGHTLGVSRRGWLVAGGAAAAAALAIAVAPFSLLAPAAQGFATEKGEHRTLTLADGSTVDLNAGSQISVAIGAHERRVTLAQGEAVFDVTHDAARPFLIAAGDRTVRVVGTRFDVRRLGGKVSVSVERGLVEVSPSEGASGRAFRLHPGQRLDHVEGAADAKLTAVDPAQFEAWKSGRLIYRDAPLADVVADLNQQFARQIVLEDPTLGAVPVSGVLVLDDQDAVVRRLALLAPIKALPSRQGVLLRRDGATKR